MGAGRRAVTRRPVHLFLRGPLSQWHPCRFEIHGLTYNCGEQFMMACKARLFGDTAMEARIMANPHPHEQKLMGARVVGFDNDIWNAQREEIVFEGNSAKFSQNSGLAKRLLATGNAMLGEANPRDYIWGIGMAEDDPLAQDAMNWRGQNLLGKTLMRVREKLRSGGE
jgi:ribA/ribD-fused uncharacterized protein